MDTEFDRIILINWRFDENYKENWEVKGSSDCQVICKNENNAQNFENFLNKLGAKNVLVLFHDNDPNKDVAKSLMQITNTEKIKYFPFKKGKDHVYNKGQYKGFLNETKSTFDINCLENSKIKKENFDFVWNYYWNSLEKQQKIYELLNESKRNNSIVEKLHKVLKKSNGEFKSIEKIEIKDLELDHDNQSPNIDDKKDFVTKFNEIKNWLETLPGKIY